MKTLRKLSLPLHGFGITAVMLLLTQSAFADGVAEDTDINNMAIVNYDVGGVGQEFIESDDAAAGGNSTPGVNEGGFTTFKVDRKINFVVVGGGTTIIAPGELNAVLAFTITNSGNDHQDFTFTAINLAGDFDMNPTEFEVWVDVDDNGSFDPGIDDVSFVDELAPDGTVVRIFVVADADSPIPGDGDLAVVQLEARAHDGNDGVTGGVVGGLAADHSADPDDAAAVQNVFAEEGLVFYNNRFEATGTYEVQTAALTVTKTSAVIDDLISTADWKAIPGATIEYTVTIVNNGSNAADNVSVGDTIQIANVTFNTGQYPNGDANITVNGVDVIALATPATCTADAPPGDADGCTYVIGTGALVLGIAAPGVLIPAGETAVFTYQVTIN